MTDIIRIGLDTSKSLFQLHGVDAAERPVLRKQLRRAEMIKFFEKLPPTVVALEACGASHHWGRLLSSFGHEVKLIAPQLAKPYVKRGKNDAADAEALCEAASRPTMRFVPIKSADQQAALMLVGVRTRLIKRRTQLANAIRGFAAEFGLTTAKGMWQVGPLLERIATDEAIPKLARDLFALQAREYVQLEREIEAAPDPHQFKSGRANPTGSAMLDRDGSLPDRFNGVAKRPSVCSLWTDCRFVSLLDRTEGGKWQTGS